MSDGPLPLPAGWPAWVNGAETVAELEGLRRRVARDRPFGAKAWVADVVRRLGWRSPRAAAPSRGDRLRCA